MKFRTIPFNLNWEAVFSIVYKTRSRVNCISFIQLGQHLTLSVIDSKFLSVPPSPTRIIQPQHPSHHFQIISTYICMGKWIVRPLRSVRANTCSTIAIRFVPSTWYEALTTKLQTHVWGEWWNQQQRWEQFRGSLRASTKDSGLSTTGSETSELSEPFTA